MDEINKNKKHYPVICSKMNRTKSHNAKQDNERQILTIFLHVAPKRNKWKVQ